MRLDDDRATAASDLRVAAMQHAQSSAPHPPTGSWHRGDWMQTFTGRKFYPLAPSFADVSIRDIAHALSLLCRYNGHVDRFYSVAEHCVLISRAIEPSKHALAALLHDAAEAYVGDMIRPLKRSMPDYMHAEVRVMTAIAYRFGLPITPQSYYSMPSAVRDADNRILLTERSALMSAAPPDKWAVEDLTPLDVVIEGWAPAIAEQQYLQRFRELTGED